MSTCSSSRLDEMECGVKAKGEVERQAQMSACSSSGLDKIEMVVEAEYEMKIKPRRMLEARLGLLICKGTETK
jgi:hypothetical protein